MEDEKYMRRALRLAALGREGVWSNPMVGAVIVAPGGRVIGEGWHRRWGEGHAEVNALASVKEEDRVVLPLSTMYVTLEPCSHQGKTGPCALRLVQEGLRRVVIGCRDPFAKVSGRGIAMLREAGIEVQVGVLEDECASLNRKFITAHTLKRPFITLKWAQTADGYLDHRRTPIHPGPLRISTEATSLLVHDLRRGSQAVLVGSGTWMADRPRLTVRGLPQPLFAPVRVVLDRRGRIPSDTLDDDVLRLTSRPGTRSNDLPVSPGASMTDIMRALYGRDIVSVLVEGGAEILRQCLNQGLWDEVKIETAPEIILGEEGAAKAPKAPGQEPAQTLTVDGHTIDTYQKNLLPLCDTP